MSATTVVKAQTPFKFYTSFILEEATGLRAATLPQLLHWLRQVPDGCLYHHTHYFLLSHHYLTPGPTNDFAYWVTEVLGEEPLGELLASIDTMQHASLQSLRDAVIETIDSYLKQHPIARFKFASEGEEFHFVKSIHVVVPTPWSAWTLEEFADSLQRVTVYSLYYHVFDSRLRLGRPTNDFAIWLEQQFGQTELAKETAAVDPYAHTLETLRALLVSLVRQQLDRDDPEPRRDAH